LGGVDVSALGAEVGAGEETVSSSSSNRPRRKDRTQSTPERFDFGVYKHAPFRIAKGFLLATAIARRGLFLSGMQSYE
jgi:hypothetical protein